MIMSVSSLHFSPSPDCTGLSLQGQVAHLLLDEAELIVLCFEVESEETLAVKRVLEVSQSDLVVPVKGENKKKQTCIIE